MLSTISQLPPEIGDVGVSLPSSWAMLLSLAIPLIPAAWFHPSYENTRWRFLLAAGLSGALAVVDVVLAVEPFTLNQLIVTFLMSVLLFMSSYKGMDTVASGDGTKAGLNDRVLPKMGLLGIEVRKGGGYRMKAPLTVQMPDQTEAQQS